MNGSQLDTLARQRARTTPRRPAFGILASLLGFGVAPPQPALACKKVGKKCGTCHEIVAEEESDSKLLQELGLQEAPPEPVAAEGVAADDGAATTGT